MSDIQNIIDNLPTNALTPAAAEALGIKPGNEVDSQPPTGNDASSQSTTGTEVVGPQNQNEERITEEPVEKLVDNTQQQGGRRTFKRKGGKRKQQRRKTHKKKRRSHKRR